jgi:ATP-dependent Clp protease protease subunit
MYQTLNSKKSRSVNSDLAESPLIVYNQRNREINLFGEINFNSACQVISALRELDKINKKPIRLIISSEGGLMLPAGAIFDTIQMLRSRVFGEAVGCCMSSAAYILQACDTRYISPTCRFMIHDVSFTISENKDDENTEEDSDPDPELVYLCSIMYKGLALKANIPLDEVVTLCNNETFMTAQEAVNYGFADEILEVY